MQRLTWARLIAFTATTGGICVSLIAPALAGPPALSVHVQTVSAQEALAADAAAADQVAGAIATTGALTVQSGRGWLVQDFGKRQLSGTPSTSGPQVTAKTSAPAKSSAPKVGPTPVT